MTSPIMKEKGWRKGKTKPRSHRVDSHILKKSKRNREKELTELAIPFCSSVLTAILQDAFEQLPRYRLVDFQHDVATIINRCNAEGLGFISKVLPKVFDVTMHRLETGEDTPYHGFKVKPDGIPAFLGQWFREIFADPDNATPYVNFLYQLCCSFKKLRGDYKKSVLARQWASLVETENELNALDLTNPELQSILARSRFLAQQFAKNFQPDGCIPRPGPGATNTPTRHYMRFEPHVLYRQINDVCPYYDWFYARRDDDIVNFHRETAKLYGNAVDEPTARFKFVPKTWEKPRGICIEEFEMQWCQQGVRRELTRMISEHDLYRRRIVFDDQSINAWLALQSSKDGTHGTLDMSEGSNRIAKALVKFHFDGTELWDYLEALSTRWIVPPKEAKMQGKLHPTSMYAPMGSALCFPVMSLMHMFLCRAIIQVKSNTNYPHFSSSQVWVYGDDIVAPSDTFPALYEYLPKFGMKLNVTKSFYRSKFRESCGVHAYNGTEITPIFVRDFPKHWQGAALKSLLETELQFHCKGLHKTASTIRRWLRDKYSNRLTYVPHGSPAVGFYRHIGDPCTENVTFSPHYKKKWSDRYQTEQVFTDVFIDFKKSVGLSSDYHRYLRWQTSSHAADDQSGQDPRLINDSVTETCTVQRRWLSASQHHNVFRC